VLRRARESDLAALHDCLRRPEAMRYWSTPEHETLEETRVWLGRMLAPPHPSDDFVVTLDGRVIGKAGAWQLPEVGYLIHPDHWGRGYAVEAMRAVVAHLFATHGMERLVAEVDPRKAGSLAALAVPEPVFASQIGMLLLAAICLQRRSLNRNGDCYYLR